MSEAHADEVEALKHGSSLGARITYRAVAWILRGFSKVFWRLEVRHAERFPQTGAFVIAPVHRSNIDFFLPALATRRKVRWMAKDSIFVGGLASAGLWMIGAFPVNRDGIDRTTMRNTLALLADGQPVVMFPEGRRKEGPTILDPFDGPAFVACRQRIPIVPVGIGGSDRAMPIGAKMIRPAKITLVIGEPIFPDVELEGRVPRSQVNALTDELVARLQDVYDEAQRPAR